MQLIDIGLDVGDDGMGATGHSNCSFSTLQSGLATFSYRPKTSISRIEVGPSIASIGVRSAIMRLVKKSSLSPGFPCACSINMLAEATPGKATNAIAASARAVPRPSVLIFTVSTPFILPAPIPNASVSTATNGGTRRPAPFRSRPW